MDKDKKPRPARRRRARKPDGKFQGDNPNTPANEAWEPLEVIENIGKRLIGKYEVKPEVSSMSNNSAGKYSKQTKLRPTFGNVTTRFN